MSSTIFAPETRILLSGYIRHNRKTTTAPSVFHNKLSLKYSGREIGLRDFFMSYNGWELLLS